MKATALLQLAAACAVFILAASSGKAWALSPSTGRIVLTLALYTLGNLIMLRLIREVGLATAISVSAVLQLVAVNAVAILVYGERFGALEGLGLGLAVLSVTLITLAPYLG